MTGSDITGGAWDPAWAAGMLMIGCIAGAAGFAIGSSVNHTSDPALAEIHALKIDLNELHFKYCLPQPCPGGSTGRWDAARMGCSCESSFTREP